MVGTQFCHVVLRVKDLLDLHGQGLESALHLGTLTSTSASVSILTVRLALGALAPTLIGRRGDTGKLPVITDQVANVKYPIDPEPLDCPNGCPVPDKP